MQQERTRNIKLTLEYDGSRYAGWQKMAGKERMVTIQGKLEEVLAKLEGKPVEVIGQGVVGTDPGPVLAWKFHVGKSFFHSVL